MRTRIDAGSGFNGGEMAENSIDSYIPGYIQAHETGILDEKIEQAEKLLEKCTICPRNCEVNRFEGAEGYCKTGKLARVSSYFPHHGEENCLRGDRGSGTIFFSNCNLLCVFCQNHEISHFGEGNNFPPGDLAAAMISLQEMGCHNINFVTPTHAAAQILQTLPRAIENGLNIPLVYNTGAYDGVNTLELLDGVVDIYMPDIKFWSAYSSKRYMNAPDYPEIAKRNLKIMHGQVGDLMLDDRGIAVKGLLVRHLVMPAHDDETGEILSYISKNISPETSVNIMFQYRPAFRVTGRRFEELNRPLTVSEMQNALQLGIDAGLTRFA